jgi:hypothetical protein
MPPLWRRPLLAGAVISYAIVDGPQPIRVCTEGLGPARTPLRRGEAWPSRNQLLLRVPVSTTFGGTHCLIIRVTFALPGWTLQPPPRDTRAHRAVSADRGAGGLSAADDRFLSLRPNSIRSTAPRAGPCPGLLFAHGNTGSPRGAAAFRPPP